jgi:hypothetical protein
MLSIIAETIVTFVLVYIALFSGGIEGEIASFTVIRFFIVHDMMRRKRGSYCAPLHHIEDLDVGSQETCDRHLV